jgi:glycosyltransferase involved in cell wall biosynthesis
MAPARIICTVTNDLHQDQRMHRICQALVEVGFEVWLVGRLKPNSRPLPPQAYRQHRLACRYHKGKLFYLEFNLRLLFFLLRHPARYINTVDLDTLLPGYLASRWHGAACVYDAHEYFTETPEVVRRPTVRRVWSWLARWLIPRADAAYTVGPALAEVLSQNYGRPFGVVRNLPLRSAASAEPPTRRVLLYQGMLNEGRGLEAAIMAMHQLPDCELWLAGDGDIRPQLQQLAAREQLNHRIQWLGFVPPAQLPELTRQAWLGLNLLENSGLSYYYSLANKSLDYIQSGLPSINMDFPEYRALCRRYGVFVLLPELSAQALAQAVRRLISHPAEYAALRQACLLAAPELCWEQEKEKLLQWYPKP